MKKKTVILICVLSAFLILCSAFLGWWIFLRKNGASEDVGSNNFTEGRVLVCGDSYLIIVGNEPIVMRDSSDGKDLFESLTTGDLIKIRCGAVMESYPAQTNVSYVEKIADGSIDDIPESVIDSLTELGWIK